MELITPFHFHSMRSLTALYNCHFREVEAGWSYQLHEHSGYELLHCAYGQMGEWIHGESVVLHPGDWLFIGPGVKHSTINESSQPFAYFSVHFGIDDAELTNALKELHFAHLSCREERLQHMFAELLDQMRANSAIETEGLSGLVTIDRLPPVVRQTFMLTVQQLVINAVGLVLAEDRDTQHAQQQPGRKKLNAAEVKLAHGIQQKLLEAVYTSATINEIAQQYFISRSHCNEVFKKVYGIAPKHYLSIMKQRAAEELLLHSGASAGEIAEKLGFTSLSSFSRQFRRWTTISPLQFRSDRDRHRHHDRLYKKGLPLST
ncbi:AraC family transcriptional regulator [Paenibacillus sp. OV219]|uniref:helix-turn-helix domain-containing protein n=1 Tax=Paenibacillus sp. OV219 TaxID=1884377 RepID=UPI0008D7D422|nr:AraC family transcriptional regulator [Paenibacillus sp. OV219]SEN16592.1 AraC-type DNA-binding protein [Paenibacillus sp. OV219]